MSRIGQSWGLYPQAHQTVIDIVHRQQNIPRVDGTMLPYGNGRSYGDSCLNDGGVLLRTRCMDRYLRFDPISGQLDCESGVLFSDILDLVVPQGWFLPVTPGTKFVTVGGAIANDVHGKNHHVTGTFGQHVLSLELLRSDGQRITCGPQCNTDWFAATVGGLGLTGLITQVTLQLRRITSPWMITETHRFADLDSFFAISQRSAKEYEYTVAWIDCAGTGSTVGRGLFTCANHAPSCPETRPIPAPRRLSIPFTPPFSLITPASLKAFNSLYFHRQRQPVAHAITHYEPFFYPLDSIRDWNRIYGPSGFMQYQCVIPPTTAKSVLEQLLKSIAAHGEGSFLAVLKQFGDTPSPGMLSFPRPGTTLALDFPNRGKRTLQLLDRLDDLVAEADGAVYPAKDARMSGGRFRQYFPAWEAFSSFIDPSFSSSFWRRVME